MIQSSEIDLKCNYCHLLESCDKGYCDFCGSCEGDFYEFPNLDFFLCSDCFCSLQASMLRGVTKTRQEPIPLQISNEIIIVDRKHLTEEDRDFIFARDDYRCVKCGSTKRLQIDHILPFSEGGKTSSENLQTLCKKCNCRKGASIP